MVVTPEKIVDIIKKTHWQVQGFNAYPLYLCAAANPSAWEVNRVFGRGYRHFVYLFERGHTTMLYDEGDWNTVFDVYRKDIRTPARLRVYAREAARRYVAAKRQTRYVPSKLKEKSLEELVALELSLAWRIGWSVGLSHLIEGIEFDAEREIGRMLAARGVTDASVTPRLIASGNPSFSLLARQALFEIHQAVGKKKEQKAVAFLEKYSWVENNYLGSARLTIASVMARADEVTAKPFFPRGAENERKKLMREFALTTAERNLIAAIVFCTDWHDVRKGRILQTIEDAEPVTEELARRAGVPRHILLHALMEELSMERLHDKTFLTTLRERYEGCVIFATPGEVRVFTKDDYAAIKRAIDDIYTTRDITEIRGTIAEKGVVRGRVAVCRTSVDIAVFPEGAILVAPMTRPEYVPAMQKAAAIVTDEGGITSHAAIIARELKKPCIIGTKIATKVLKTGDMVEVDADRGMIKIVS